jgi:AcrR family transcriptional regulator
MVQKFYFEIPRKETGMKNMEPRILLAAKNMFERFGFKKTTVDEIAFEAGVAKSTLYQHFKSKEDLFMNVVINEAHHAREDVFQRLGTVASPLQRLRKLGEIALTYFHETRFISSLLSEPNIFLGPVKKSQLLAAAEGEMIEIISQIIKEGQKTGEIQKVNPRITAYMFLKVFQAFTFARTDSLPIEAASQEEEIKQILNLLIQAIQT